jgi:ketosteroid isomerase-like protein
MTTRIDNWIDGYLRAWESNEPSDIRALFTDDAVYRTDPWTEPWRGVEAIVAGWLERKDEAGTSTFEWSPVIANDEIAVVEGTTTYTTRDVTYSNLWVIRFAPDGRATEYTEWWMDQADPS